MKPVILYSFVNVSLLLSLNQAASGQSAVDTNLRPNKIDHLDPWSRTEVTLGSRSAEQLRLLPGSSVFEAAGSRDTLDVRLPNGGRSRHYAPENFGSKGVVNQWLEPGIVLKTEASNGTLFPESLGSEAQPASEHSAMIRAIHRAALSGVAADKIKQTIVENVLPKLEKGAQVAARALLSNARSAQDEQTLKSRSVSTAILLAELVLECELSEEEVLDWLRSRDFQERVIRGGADLVAVEVSARIQAKLLGEMEKSVGSKVGGRLLRRYLVRVRLPSLGAASLIFVAGEGLIAAFQGEGVSEVLGRAGESVLIFAIAEGTVLTAELIFAGEIGAFGGPLGVILSVAATAAFEGGRYLWTVFWTEPRQREAEASMFIIRCDVARDKMNDWARKTQDAIVGSRQE